MTALERFAQERGFEYHAAGAVEGPFSLLRRGEGGHAGGLARGELADGREAQALLWLHSEPGPDGAAREVTHTAVIAAVPESAAAFPWLECRSREAEMLGEGDASGSPGMETIRLESEFFETRFRLLAGPGTDPHSVTQLFAPDFLHWYAYEAPFAMTLELIGGRLCLYVPGEMDRPGHLDSFWEAAARVADQLAKEGLENRGEA